MTRRFALLLVGTAMAALVLDLLGDPDLLTAVREEFHASTSRPAHGQESR